MSIVREGKDGQSTGTLTLKIDNFNPGIGTVLSPNQNMWDLEWRIKFGYSDDGQHPSFYLQCYSTSKTDTSWCCYAQVELILVSQDEGTENLTRELHRCFHAKLLTAGFKPFGSSNKFTDPEKGYNKNNTIILQANIRVPTGQRAVFNSPASRGPATSSSRQGLTLTVTRTASQASASQVSNQTNELPKGKIPCDVNILVNDTVFPCYRNELAAACDYFKTMFTHDFVKSGKKVVTLQNTEPNIFKQILDFIRTGKICIDYQNVVSMFKSSEYLGLPFIEDLCFAYFESHVPRKDIGKLFGKQKRRRHILYYVAQRYVEHYFVDLSDELLIRSPPGVLKEILTSKYVKSNTNAVLSFLLAWVKKNGDTQFVLELLKSVNGTLSMDVTCLVQLINGMMEVNATNPSK